MGIGFACAEELVRGGARVVICAREQQALTDAEAKLRSVRGTVVQAVRADVTSPADIERVLDAAYALGGLHGLVHCAAVPGPIGPAVDVAPEAWWEAVRIDLFGTFLTARAVCQRMISTQIKGSLVLMSGGGATMPFPRYTAYAAAKVGVVRFAETLALEVAGHGIRVNCVAPGFVATRMHQETLKAGERAGSEYLERTKRELHEGGVPPSLAARAAAFLVSSRAAGVTGRLLAAPWDDWDRWPEHVEEIGNSDLFTLRRIVPRDRGKDWQ